MNGTDGAGAGTGGGVGAGSGGVGVRAQRFAGLLRGRKGRRVYLRDLWAILDEADPALGTDARRRSVLADVLAELAGAGLLTLPGERSYDRTEHPPLPRFVTLPAPRTPAPVRHQVVWHHDLNWVPETRITPAQRDRLEAVDRWLKSARRDASPAPLRERSLEVFGDEKVLDRLLRTGLFGPGKLDLELLVTYRAAVRFTSETVGSGDLLLVVENADTFDSLVHALRARAGHRVGAVAWGAGAAFEASVLSIARLSFPVAEVAYFGDLDEKGLRIPANAAALAAAEGLPAVRPATGLYGALLERARPQGGQRKLTAATADEVTAWLDPPHRARVREFLMAGERAAQEAVGREYLTATDTWATDLYPR
ncbi:DUF2399 domain-containing protein [Actinoallomurus rhizosphaericola]|uniref:DUF2399 domain-containing protein n=1 Tax=Actinoallomurus rhizosphaericola TaxID=2952536 RepID=UPI002093201E|nr:DUF2399 domain-containing protein [Actinoallomurus rhizosphaericola]MCO5996242.1 DUF2399 domain-containing protein [Actinoallomurus rhizosphaericola]